MKTNRILSIIFMSIFFLFMFFNTAIAEDQAWSVSYYSKYTTDSFKNYEPAKQLIDFENIDYALLNASVFYETNRMRKKHNRELFKHSQALEDSSQMHSKDMVDYKFFDHNNPYDSDKHTPFKRMEMFGVKDGTRGENVAIAFAIAYESGTPVYSIEDIPHHTYISYAEDLVDGWMNSPGHRANILNADFKYLGCGNFFFLDNQNGWKWPMFKATQNFGSVVPDEETGSTGNNSTNTIDNDNNSTNTIDNNSTGSNLTYSFSKGYYEKIADKKWEKNEGKSSVSYDEVGIDDHFYYLYNSTINEYIAIPIEGGMLYYYDMDKKQWIEDVSVTKS